MQQRQATAQRSVPFSVEAEKRIFKMVVGDPGSTGIPGTDSNGLFRASRSTTVGCDRKEVVSATAVAICVCCLLPKAK